MNVSSVFKKDNKFWMFGEKGLYFFDEKNNTGRTYTVEDGLPANEFSFSAFAYSPRMADVLQEAPMALFLFFQTRNRIQFIRPGHRLRIFISMIFYTLHQAIRMK